MRRSPLIASLLLLGALCVPALAAPGDLTVLYGGWPNLNAPRGVSEAADGSILIADTENHRVLRVTRNGAATTVAGIRNEPGFTGDGGPATQAKLHYPLGVAALLDGGFLIADSDNHRIRRVSAGGTITTVAGGGYNEDGCDARRVWVDWPESVVPASGGGFLIADSSQDRVRRVWPDGSVTTVAGSRGGPIDREGIPATDARFSNPTDASFTHDGGFLVTDSTYNRIRRVTADGTITTVAGTGYQGTGVTGDGGPATAAQVGRPHAVAAASDGSFLIAQELDHRIRAVAPDGTITTLAGGREGSSVSYPHDVVLLAGGGGVVTDTGQDTVKLLETHLRPATPPPATFQGTGGFAGACFGLDPSFGGGTVRSAQLTDRVARGLVLQPGGKVVVAGEPGTSRWHLALERYLPSGELDRSFGSNGLAMLDRYEATVFWVGPQSDGKLIAVGGASIDGAAVVVAVRFTPDGALDPTFGDRGVAQARPLNQVTAVDIAEDGRIVLAGADFRGSLLARLDRDGARDGSFGNAGVAPGPWSVVALETLPGGGVVTLSPPQVGAETSEAMTVTRFTAGGAIDRTFARDGRTNLVPVQTFDLTNTAMALQADGGILVAGTYWRDLPHDIDFPIVVGRLHPDGTLDRSFGDAGFAVIDPVHYRWPASHPAGAAEVHAIAVQPDGRIVMGGRDEAGGGFSVHRLLPSGALDRGFGDAGRIITSMHGGGVIRGVAVRPDGKIVAAGESRSRATIAVYQGTRPPKPAHQTGTTTPTGTPVGGFRADGAAARGGIEASTGRSQLSIAGWRSARIRTLLRGGWTVSVKAPAPGQIYVTLAVRGRTLATGRATARRAGRVTVPVRSMKRARALLTSRRRAVKATLTVRLRGAASSGETKRTVHFRR